MGVDVMNQQAAIRRGRRHLTPEMASRFLDVHYRTVLQWIKVGHPKWGKLPALDISVGNHPCFRIYRKDLEEWMQRKGASTRHSEEITRG